MIVFAYWLLVHVWYDNSEDNAEVVIRIENLGRIVQKLEALYN